ILHTTISFNNFRQSTIPVLISRVNQVDAARLDIEMSAMLKEQLVKVFTLMKFLIWCFSIWVDKPTPGNALMNLRYRDERVTEVRGKVGTGLEGPGLSAAQKLWYCIASVGGQGHLHGGLGFSYNRIEGIYKAASFINLLLFLYSGKIGLGNDDDDDDDMSFVDGDPPRREEQVSRNEAKSTVEMVRKTTSGTIFFRILDRSLIERVLRARLVYRSPTVNRAVSFEYMNRQLVWNAFSEMLLSIPLLSSTSIRNFLRPFSKDKSSSSSEDEIVCPICQANPTTEFLALPCQDNIIRSQ
ncbi:Pex, N-terminal, partial [Dillenia turbinata]